MFIFSVTVTYEAILLKEIFLSCRTLEIEEGKGLAMDSFISFPFLDTAIQYFLVFIIVRSQATLHSCYVHLLPKACQL